MSATLTLPPRPSTRTIQTTRVMAIPVLSCDRCGDDLLAVQPPLLCAKCVRQANKTRRWAASMRARRHSTGAVP